MKMKTKKDIFLENKAVSRWYDNVARGALSTANVYVRRLQAFCDSMGVTPEKLCELNEEDVYHLILDFVTKEEKRGKAGSFITHTLKSVKSWLGFNGIIISRKINVKGARKTPTIRDEKTPNQEELHKIFLAGDHRARACCALIAHSGVRIGVLGNYLGDDGLRVKDFPEMVIENDEVSFSVVPTMLRVREELSKTDREYFTFLSEQGCEYLKDYLEYRIRNGEKLTMDSDIITPKIADKSFITAINIGDIIRKAIRAAGFKWRPYVLRAYFDTQMLISESKSKMTHSYRQFFMGHSGDMEARYTTNKGRLPEELIEDMRDAYRSSEKYLITIKSESNKENVETNFKKQLLKVMGVSDDELGKMDLEEAQSHELVETLRKKLIGLVTGSGSSQKVISDKEVEEYINNGWEYVRDLPKGQAIVKFPG